MFRLARTSVAPIFFIWLGTCEFTIKEARNLYINEDTSVNVDLVVRKYESFKREILSINNKATVLFIECPPVLCSRWNVFRGVPGRSVDTDNTDDRLLQAIQYFNGKVNEMNGSHNAPRLYQDLIQTSKKKNSSIKYK